jgi:transposase
MLSNVDVESKLINFSSRLSARAKKCCLTQVLGIIGASVEKQRKRVYQYNKTPNAQLLKKIEQNIPKKPDITQLNPELNSICCDFEKSNGEFNGFVQLKSIGKEYGKIRLPIKFHRNNKKYWDWNLKNSFLINDNWINFRWENKVEKKQNGIVVGCDQGKKDVVTFSNGMTPPKTNNHGKSLDSIMLSLSKCKKGSKRFQRKQKERKNFINWSINQLNLTDVKEVRLEKVWNIGYKNKTSRLMSHWTNTLIRDKLKSKCELLGVQVKEQSCTYRSQRCSSCGMVRKSQRKAKLYKCKECGFELDSDLNAALNHEVDLPDIPWEMRREQRNRKGFYWLESGFFDLNRVQFTVELTKNKVTSQILCDFN